MKTQCQEGDGRILLGDNTGGGVVMLRPTRFQCVGVWRSTGLLCLFDVHEIQTRKVRLETDLPERKGKVIPLQAWSAPEGSRKLRFPHYMTTAQEGGKVVSLTHRPPLPPGKAPATHFC